MAMRLRPRLLGLALAMAATLPALAQTHAPEAVMLAQQYHDVHNRHDLAGTMKLYAADATFQLNMGRELVRGRDAIAELERFDAVAGSVLLPHGWRAEPTPQGWAVHVAAVLEHSRVFSAMGLDIVVAVPEAPVMVFGNGQLLHVNQPPLRAACSEQIMAGFKALAAWLQTRERPLAPVLVSQGRLVLKPELLPALLEEAALWRTATGWRPEPGAVRACAEPVDAMAVAP